MNYFSKEYKLFLAEHWVFDAWQYIINTKKNIITASYCQKVISALISQMTSEHKSWVNDLNKQVAREIKEFGTGRIGVDLEDFPDFQINILGVRTDYPFLVDKLIKDFFQYIRNAFDGMLQIANAALLANESMNVEKVSLKELNKSKYPSLFPKSAAFINSTFNNDEFKYCSNFNNMIKHICDAKVIISHELFSGNTISQIGPFFKNGKSFEEEEICNITERVLKYVESQYTELLAILTEEIKLENFVEGRIHSLAYYGQIIKDDPKNSFTVVFIEVQESLDELPDELRILLVNSVDDDVVAVNCDYSEILVRDANGKYIGQFICDEEIKDKDKEKIKNKSLLRYRRYKKDICNGNGAFINQTKKSIPIKLHFMTGKIVEEGFKESDNSNSNS